MESIASDFAELQRAIESFERAASRRRALRTPEAPLAPVRPKRTAFQQHIRRFLEGEDRASWKPSRVIGLLTALAGALYLGWVNRDIKPAAPLGLFFVSGVVMWWRRITGPSRLSHGRRSAVDVSNVKYSRSAWPVGILFILAIAGFFWILPNVLAPSSEAGLYAELPETAARGWLSRQIRINQTYPHWQRALVLLDDGDLETSKAELEAVLDIDSGHLRARMTLATVHHRLNEHESVVAGTSTVLEQVRGFVPALLYRGMSAQTLGDSRLAIEDYRAIVSAADPESDAYRSAVQAWADLSLEKGDLEGALAARAHAPKDTHDVHYYIRQGNTLTGLGRAEEALAAYESAAPLATTTADKFVVETGIAEAAQATGNPARAKASYLSALLLRPGEPTVLRALSNLEYSEGQLAAADRWISQLTDSDLTVADREFLANLRFAQRQYRDAGHRYLQEQAMVQTETDRHRLLMAAGRAYTLAQQNKNAVQAFRAAARSREDPPTLEALAQALDDNGELAESVQTLERLQSLQPLAQTRYRIAELYFRLGSNDRAIEQVDLALAEGLDSTIIGQALRLRGFALSATGAHRQAQASLEAALGHIPPPDAAAFEKLGELAMYAEADEVALGYLTRAVELRPTAVTLRKLATLHLRVGNVDSAISTLERIQGLKSSDVADDGEILVEIATLEFDRGNHHRAGELYLEAFERSPVENFASGVRAAEAFALSAEAEADWRRALQINTRLFEIDDLPNAERARGFERSGHLLARLGEYEQAALAFESAIAAGRDNWQLQRDAGFMWSNVDRWPEALRHFEASLDLRRSPETLRRVGIAYQETEKPGLAIHYLREAIDEDPQGQGIPLKATLDQLGYGYATTEQHARAAEVWRRSLSIEEDPTIQVRLARMERLSRRPDLAAATLTTVDVDRLPTELRVEFLKERAAGLRAEQNAEGALTPLQQAAALSDDPEIQFQLAGAYRELEAWDAAIRHLQQARGQEPMNDLYAIELAYAYVAIDQLDFAAALFDEVLARTPDYLRLYGDLGFLQLRRTENSAALDRFKQAIDNRSLQLMMPDVEQSELAAEQQRLRRTVTEVSKTFQGTAYIAPRSDPLAEVRTPGGSVGGVLPSQGGLDLWYRPPDVGYRDGRIFQVFGRLLWNFEPRSPKVARDSLQAGLGIRYKPLKTQTLFLSAERLIKIGANAENSWLLRGLYSWDTNATPPRLDGQLRDYRSLYADLGYFFRSPDRWVGYLEGRQGVTLDLNDDWHLSPHAVGDVRYQDPSTTGSSYVEGGVGLSLKYLFNSNEYEFHRSGLELLFHYKWGTFLGTGTASPPGRFRGWVFTPVITF